MAEVGKLPLDKPAVATAPGADAPVRPGLAGSPGERVLRVDSILCPGVELALRLVPAAYVDDDGGVAAAGEPDTPAMNRSRVDSYGVHWISVGKPRPPSGRYTSAERVIPSATGTR